jgi:hypothetical protein
MNGFAFADDGPRGAVVIRNIIMMNRDEAEGHIAAGGAVKESAKRLCILLLEHFHCSKMCVRYAYLRIQIQSNSDWIGKILTSLWIRLQNLVVLTTQCN